MKMQCVSPSKRMSCFTLGLLWSKQFYHYIIEAWLEGDPDCPKPPAERYGGRNASGDWDHLFNKDIISMPDKWEYPWVGVVTHRLMDEACYVLLLFCFGLI